MSIPLLNSTDLSDVSPLLISTSGIVSRGLSAISTDPTLRSYTPGLSLILFGFESGDLYVLPPAT
ncbi:MAG TPA: hypothetical protein VLG45_11385 [Thermodesulfobacteriota bacterium]|nr:hypothetical protein [Thermodesulfobacteriota bacterium]